MKFLDLTPKHTGKFVFSTDEVEVIDKAISFKIDRGSQRWEM